MSYLEIQGTRGKKIDECVKDHAVVLLSEKWDTVLIAIHVLTRRGALLEDSVTYSYTPLDHAAFTSSTVFAVSRALACLSSSVLRA